LEIKKPTLKNLKEVGKKNETYDQLIRRRIKCNNAGCEAIGSIEVNIENGKFGSIRLFVCPNCVGKIQDED
jgi:hypothetical protein